MVQPHAGLTRGQVLATVIRSVTEIRDAAACVFPSAGDGIEPLSPPTADELDSCAAALAERAPTAVAAFRRWCRTHDEFRAAAENLHAVGCDHETTAQLSAAIAALRDARHRLGDATDELYAVVASAIDAPA
jgi:hypothetical protein